MAEVTDRRGASARGPDPVPQPIFVGGDGRSGTTLLSLMLDSHPDVVLLPEIHFHLPPDVGPTVLHCLDLIEADDPRTTSTGMVQHEEIRLGVQFIRRCRRAGVDAIHLRLLVEEAMEQAGSDLRIFEDRVLLVDRIGRLAKERSSKPIWGIKIMKQITRSDLFKSYWRDAVFVHVIRDGRDVAASQILDHSWGYNDIETAAVTWAGLMDRMEELAVSVDLIQLRYEDLVREPVSTMKVLLEGLRLPWDDQVLDPGGVPHLLLESDVRHPSAAAAVAPLNDTAIGRYRRDLDRLERNVFVELAGRQLIAKSYEALPEVEVRFLLDDPHCQRLEQCARYRERCLASLGGRYIGLGRTEERQVRAARLPLTEHASYEDYRQHIKKMYRGNILQDARKADRAGFVCHPFARSLHVPDIVEINTSKETRSGGRMKDAYRKSVSEMGGFPVLKHEFELPPCPLHYDWWWGIFEPHPGYKQGDVVTDEKLLAYIDLRRYGNFALYNLIIGHGDYLRLGIMYRLHLEVMEWLLGGDSPHRLALDHLIYAGFYQGGEGLQLWKKKTGFSPALLVTDE